MSEENVKVAVRVRPFNKRELDANSKLCVQMNGNQTTCTDLKTNAQKDLTKASSSFILQHIVVEYIELN